MFWASQWDLVRNEHWDSPNSSKFYTNPYFFSNFLQIMLSLPNLILKFQIFRLQLFDFPNFQNLQTIWFYTVSFLNFRKYQILQKYLKKICGFWFISGKVVSRKPKESIVLGFLGTICWRLVEIHMLFQILCHLFKSYTSCYLFSKFLG